MSVHTLVIIYLISLASPEFLCVLVMGARADQRKFQEL
jgi:hypothetical protein